MEDRYPDPRDKSHSAGAQMSGPTVDPGFLPASPPRANTESIAVRCIATAGVAGIGTAMGAILDSASVSGWIVGLVVSLVSVVLAAVLWRSRTL